MNVTFFRTPADFREWLERHHADTGELWVGYYKKNSGRQSVTWPETVDQALCFGWIDGIRKSIDETAYAIRFTPRKTTSTWSNVNINRARELAAQGLMHPAGLRAFEARKENKSGIYSYEQRTENLPEPFGSMLKENKAAWDFFHTQPSSYRRAAGWWIVSARKEETRLKRLERLIHHSAEGRRIPQFTRISKSR